MRRKAPIFVVFAIVVPMIMAASIAVGQSDTPTNAKKIVTDSDQNITYMFDDDTDKPAEKEYRSFGDIEQLFRNPAILAGLNSGADVINRSVETILDAVFYSIMDHNFAFPFTQRTSLLATIDRRIFSTTSGANVVVDRVGLGPSYNQLLGRVKGLPFNMGIDGSFDVFDIYMRTDGMRLAEQTDLPLWRVVLNNWLGILPLLGNILPPSFNPNELYDPLHQVEVPFLFPLTKRKLQRMPIGGIRSYALSGGAHVGVDPMDIVGNAPKEWLAKYQNLGLLLPYTIFSRAEHRVNILRRSKHIVWVGLSQTRRLGHTATATLAGPVTFLTGVIPYWKGVQMEIAPLAAHITGSRANVFDQVFEYDMRRPEAEEAYLAAVRGDFTVSAAMDLRRKRGVKDTGVTFHFTRSQQRRERDTGNNHQLLVAAITSSDSGHSAEVEITDGAGRYHLLESENDGSRRKMDIITGAEESRATSEVVIKVRKQSLKSGDYRYVLGSGAREEPILAYINFKTQDSHVDSDEFYQYADALRFATSLDLSTLPHPPLKDPARQSQWRQETFFESPGAEHQNLHVTKTIIGRVNSQATVCFPWSALKRVAARRESDLWRAFARSFGVPEARWVSRSARDAWINRGQWVASYAISPLRLAEIRVPSADAWGESRRAIGVLGQLRSVTEPLDMLDKLHELFNTEYPDNLAHALIELAGENAVARRVSFFTKPASRSPDPVRKAFKALNKKTYASDAPFPEDSRYTEFREKLAAFYPEEMTANRFRPWISHVEVSARGVEERAVHIRVKAERLATRAPFKIYMRLEQTGKIKFGKLVLAEKVLSLSPDQDGVLPSFEPNTPTIYDTDITGSKSPLRDANIITTMLFDSTVNRGGDLQLVLMASQDGSVWSDERIIQFRLDKGRLLPPTK